MKKVAIFGIVAVITMLSLLVLQPETVTRFGNADVLASDRNNQTIPETKFYDEALLANLIHDNVNLYRMGNNQTQLEYDHGIEMVAGLHAADMKERKYVEHVSLEGVTPSQRGLDAGYAVCGDIETIIMQDRYYSDLELHNQKRTQYNNEANTLNQEIINYNNDIKSLYPLEHSGEAVYNQYLKKLERERQSIDLQKNSLDSKKSSVDTEQKNLDAIRNEINERNEQGLIGVGFTENIFKGALWANIIEDGQGNIMGYQWKTEEQIAEYVVKGWSQSPHHNENMLDPYHNSEGIGVAIDYDTNEFIIVQDFC